MSWAEAKWTVDQILQKVGRVPDNMRAFSVSSVSKTSLGVRFLEPADSYDSAGNLMCSVGGVMIRMSETDYPANTGDGTLVIDNKDLGKYATDAFEVSDLVDGKTYYFSAFPYSSQGVYNLSRDESNRATGSPAGGEAVTVNVNIDDTTGFSSVTITCVDETNPTETKTATITATQRTASFTIPIGHTYHIEYGAADGYSKPDNTAPKVSVAGETTTYEATYYYFTATIDVTYSADATLTCSLGETVYTAPTTTGTYQFQVHKVGTWTLKATNGDESESKQVVITSNGQQESVELVFLRIYGISRDIIESSPAWARTDNAVGMTATASVGVSAGHSDFDNARPWQGMVRETLSTGDVMVKIPKFWYRRYREGNIEYIKIANKPTAGFSVHPLFNHGGVESEYAYVGAYKTSAGTMSVSGASPMVKLTIGEFRDNAKLKGAGWNLLDIAALSAIQMLILVEFADNNVQSKIGRGYCDDNDGSLSTGSCDSVPNLTGRPSGTDGKTGVVYRGIEDFWGNIGEWVDGVYVDIFDFYVCNDPSKYDDRSRPWYTALSYMYLMDLYHAPYITEVGLDTGNNPHVMLPSAADSGSESTYCCDKCRGDTKHGVFHHGGDYSDGSDCGIFAIDYSNPVDRASPRIGSRLLYIPS